VRIFYASGKRPNGALADSQVWRENLYLSLVDLGHDVVEFEHDLEPLLAAADFTVPANAAFVAEHRPAAEAALLAQISTTHAERPVDLFFSYFYSSCAGAETIREIRRMGITTMNWYCNASYQLHLVADIAPAYDYCLVPEKFRLDDYRALGANPVYCQEAANPNVYHPYDVPRQFEVTFVGARYAERPLYLRRLIDAGIDTHAWGPGWQDEAGFKLADSAGGYARALLGLPAWKRTAKRAYKATLGRARYDLPVLMPRSVCEGPLSDEDMVKMYSRSAISLGFSDVAGSLEDGRRITQIRLRDFEAPMSGAFYMVEYMDELAEFFDIGREVVCYEDLDDLVDKCRYYLVHEEERERIRLAGLRRALNDHTWQKRFHDVFETIGMT
jgi:spore maturation protein CgeB